jgi:hypothetical protein
MVLFLQLFFKLKLQIEYFFTRRIEEEMLLNKELHLRELLFESLNNGFINKLSRMLYKLVKY